MRKAKGEAAAVLKKGQQDILLDYNELRKAVLVLRAVNHKLRNKHSIIDGQKKAAVLFFSWQHY